MAKPALAKTVAGEAKAHVKILGGFVALLWIIQIVNALSGGALVALGIHPRTLFGLLGVLFAPLIHASFAHLIANTVPLVVLGWFVMLRRKRDLFIVSALSGLVGGLGTWLVAPADSVHVGASILIFGYLGYLLLRGIFERRLLAIAGSVAVCLLYGGALFGVLPGQEGISWQGHLFGLIGGIMAARLLRVARPDEGMKKRVEPLSPARSRVLAPPSGGALEAETESDDVEAELAELRRRKANVP